MWQDYLKLIIESFGCMIKQIHHLNRKPTHIAQAFEKRRFSWTSMWKAREKSTALVWNLNLE
jgi:hypothetical protein